MPQNVEFLRIFSKPIVLLVLPFLLVLLGTAGRPAARRVGLVCAGAMVFMACYPIVAISVSVVSAMTDRGPVYTVKAGLLDGEGAAVPGDYPLRLSYYNPALGGINCDHDCSAMASGDKTAWWMGGRNGVYAAACPREWGWGHGARFSVAGLEFECRDTGGWINCYAPGETDEAIANAHARGYLLDQPAIAKRNYCWVDLMTPAPVASYGTLANDWNKE
jgi:hypothetical protein